VAEAVVSTPDGPGGSSTWDEGGETDYMCLDDGGGGGYVTGGGGGGGSTGSGKQGNALKQNYAFFVVSSNRHSA